MEYFSLQLTAAEGDLITLAIIDSIASGSFDMSKLDRAVAIMNRITWSREMDGVLNA